VTAGSFRTSLAPPSFDLAAPGDAAVLAPRHEPAPGRDPVVAQAATPRCLVDACLSWIRPVPGAAAVALTDTSVLVTSTSDEGRSLVASLALDDGTTRWTTSLGAPTPRRATSGPAAGSQSVLLRTAAGTVAAVDRATGARRFEVEEGAAGLPVAVLDADQRIVGVFDAGGGVVEVVGFDVATGTPRWRAEGASAVLSSTSVLLTTDDDLRALSPVDGVERWRRPLPTPSERASSSAPPATAPAAGLTAETRPPTTSLPAVVGGVVVVGDGLGVTSVVRIEDGAVLGVVEHDVTPLGPPVDGLLLLSDGSVLVGVDGTGHLWRTATPEGVCCGGHVVDARAVTVTLTRGRLLTVDRTSGTRVEVVAAPTSAHPGSAASSSIAGWASGGFARGAIRLDPLPAPTDAGGAFGSAASVAVIDVRTGTALAVVPASAVVTPLGGGRVLVAARGYLAVVDGAAAVAAAAATDRDTPPDGRAPGARTPVESVGTFP
jgi:outer membrane protein assembly factor BamB